MKKIRHALFGSGMVGLLTLTFFVLIAAQKAHADNWQTFVMPVKYAGSYFMNGLDALDLSPTNQSCSPSTNNGC